MKLISIATITAGLLPSVWSSAIPVPQESATSPSSSFEKRGLISTINTPPQGQVVCNGYGVGIDDINEALSQGTRWAGANPPIQMGMHNHYPPQLYSAKPKEYAYSHGFCYQVRASTRMYITITKISPSMTVLVSHFMNILF